jgi:hypothetical protein
VKVTWETRFPPLSPCGAAALGDVARDWVGRLLRSSDEVLATFSGVGGAGGIVVLGADLPWVDGLEWLGRDALAPALLLPTNRRPSVPVDVLQEAVLARSRGRSSPIALLGDGALAVPCGDARPLTRAKLLAR